MRRYTSSDKMRELVNDNYSLILVMGRFGLSLGFGDKTVKEVCQAHNVDEQTFIEVANFCSNRDYDCENISLESLIGYLKQAHEYYLEFNLPNIRRKLIEAIDCSGSNDIAMLIVRFYDEYVTEVRKHMEHENNTVFNYVEQLLQGFMNRNYTITTFEGKHLSISDSLKELKDIIIRYYPEKNNYLLNEVLLNIIQCEEDITSHCMIEDKLFVPAVKLVESKLRTREHIIYADDVDSAATDRLEVLSEREKDVLINVAKGLSNKEIADKLCLSVHTVATHRRNISGKLQIHSTAGLIIYAIANKLIDLHDIHRMI